MKFNIIILCLIDLFTIIGIILYVLHLNKKGISIGATEVQNVLGVLMIVGAISLFLI